MAELRIRVGASLDASIETVFPRIASAANRARRNVEKEMNSAGAAVPKAMKAGTSKAEAEFDKLAAEVMGKGGRMMAPGTKAIEAFGKEAKTRFGAARTEFNAMARAMESDMKRVDKAQKGLASTGVSAKSGPSFWTGRASPARLAMGAAGMAAGIAADVARGAGVDIDPQAMVRSFVQRQMLSTQIAHAGFVEGASGAAGTKQRAGDIQNEATSVAKNVGGSSQEMLEGLQKFVSFTGDLETGRALMTDMAKMSVATGTSMEDVATMASKISKNLGDVPNKAQAVNAVMLKLAGMGRIGAADIQVFAAELSKLAPMAARLGGDRATGIAKMGTLMQLAMAGGAKGASEASTAAVRFVDSLTKGPTQKAWAKQGLTPFTDSTHTQVKDPLQIMMDVLQRTKGDQTDIARLFTSGPAKQVIEPLRQAYMEAGGGTQGSRPRSPRSRRSTRRLCRSPSVTASSPNRRAPWRTRRSASPLYLRRSPTRPAARF